MNADRLLRWFRPRRMRRPVRPHCRLELEWLEARTLLDGGALANAPLLDLAGGQAAAAGPLGSLPALYRLVAETDGRLTAQVQTDGGARLSLLAPDGRVLVQSDGQVPDRAGGVVDMHLQGSPTGTPYYLEVQALGTAAGSYRLTAQYVAAGPPGQPLVTGLLPWAITAADFNGDGTADLAVGNYNSQDVSVMLGRGDGTFAPSQVAGAGAGINGLAAGDFNGDSVLDLATANFTDGTISVLLGIADGRWQDQVVYAVGNGTGAVAAADFNADGSLDLAAVNFGDSTAALLLNDGHGTFGAPTPYPVGANPYGIAVGDFNNDGVPDLVTANYTDNTVTIFYGHPDEQGRPDGTLGTAATFTVGGQPYTIAVGDFNRDSRLDLATADYGTSTVSVLLALADNAFAPAVALPTGAGTSGIVARDFTGDGVLDLATADFLGGTVSVFSGRGDGTFAGEPALHTNGGATALAAADFNGDGRVDLANANVAPGRVNVLLGRGDGTFQAPRPASPGVQPYCVARGDFDTDGRVDLATVNYATGSVQILLGRGDGTFAMGGGFATGSDSFAVETGDFNEDGNLDLVTANFSTADVSLLSGNGDGSFQAPVFLPAGQAPAGLAVGDFDRDGHLDFVVVSLGDGTLQVMRGDGRGAFSATTYEVGEAPFYVLAADLDGDGTLDLAVPNFGSGSLSVLYGTGEGSFRPPVELAGGARPEAVTAGDFNGDGRTDLAMPNFASHTVSLYYGLPDGTLASQQVLAAGVNPTMALAGDFTRDGRDDLVVLNGRDNTAVVYAGQASGLPQAFQTLAVGLSPYLGLVEDFNADGWLDVATVNIDSSDVSILLGQPDGTLANARGVPIPSGPNAIAQGDLNGDGFLDLVTANSTTGEVRMSLGQGDGTFHDSATYQVGRGVAAVVVADFLGDGRPDVLVSNAIEGTLTALIGLGDGTFRNLPSISVGSGTAALAAGQLGDDAHADLVAANYLSGDVLVFTRQTERMPRQDRYRVGRGPGAVVLGDLNGDGHTDIVVANVLSQDLSVLLGQADSAFVSLPRIPLGVSPAAVVAGDFHGDGLLDIAVASPGAGGIYLLSGQGNGTFQAPRRVASLAAPSALVTGDFDRDGRLDLAAADQHAGTATVLLGRGNGTFQAAASFQVGPYPLGLVAGDFNNDGRLDVVTANGLGVPVAVGLGLGNGALLAPGGALRAIESRPVVADLNHDGTLDVTVLRQDGKILFRAGLADAPGLFGSPIIVNPEPNTEARELTLAEALGRTYLVAANARQGTFAVYFEVDGSFVRFGFPPSSAIVPVHVQAGDLNGDGLLDIAMTLADAAQILVYVQNPNDDMSLRDPAYRIDIPAAVSDMILADVNGDGRSDIVLTEESAGRVHLLLNSEAHPFSTRHSFAGGTGLSRALPVGGAWQVESQDRPIALVTGQFNGDGILDLAILQRGTQRVDLLLGDGHGGVLNPDAEIALPTGRDPVSIVTADFNRDGHDDLAVLNQESQDLCVFLGDGLGSFRNLAALGSGSAPGCMEAGPVPVGLSAADVNEDGVPDLFISNAFGDVLSLLGRGDGTFQPYRRAGGTVTLAVADFDGDGTQEVARADAALDRVVVEDASEPRSSFVQERANGLLGPTAVTAADLDDDGLPDLIVANRASNDVLVYLRLSDGQFAAPQRFFAGMNPAGVTVQDLNGDNLPDLLVANAGSNDVSILLGQRQGTDWTLTPGPRLRTGAGPVATVAGDVNGDAIADLFVANRDANTVSLLYGIGLGFFDDRNPTVFATGVAPTELFLGRFTGGATLDLVTVNSGSNDLTVFPGLGAGQTIGSGGLAPVAAVMGHFSGRGQDELIVANAADGRLALFLSEGGSLVLRATVLLGGTRPTDLAVAGLSNGSVSLYVTSPGSDSVARVTFTLLLGLFAPTGDPAPSGSSSWGTNPPLAYALTIPVLTPVLSRTAFGLDVNLSRVYGTGESAGTSGISVTALPGFGLGAVLLNTLGLRGSGEGASVQVVSFQALPGSGVGVLVILVTAPAAKASTDGAAESGTEDAPAGDRPIAAGDIALLDAGSGHSEELILNSFLIGIEKPALPEPASDEAAEGTGAPRAPTEERPLPTGDTPRIETGTEAPPAAAARWPDAISPSTAWAEAYLAAALMARVPWRRRPAAAQCRPRRRHP